MSEEEEIVIRIKKNVHPALYNQMREAMDNLNCKTGPELMALMFERASFSKRIRREIKRQLVDLGLLEWTPE